MHQTVNFFTLTVQPWVTLSSRFSPCSCRRRRGTCKLSSCFEVLPENKQFSKQFMSFATIILFCLFWCEKLHSEKNLGASLIFLGRGLKDRIIRGSPSNSRFSRFSRKVYLNSGASRRFFDNFSRVTLKLGVIDQGYGISSRGQNYTRGRKCQGRIEID